MCWWLCLKQRMWFITCPRTCLTTTTPATCLARRTATGKVQNLWQNICCHVWSEIHVLTLAWHVTITARVSTPRGRTVLATATPQVQPQLPHQDLILTFQNTMKTNFEIMDDAAQAFLKVKIMDNIHKYYYLIVFTAYMREMAEVARTTMTDEQKAALTLPGGKTAIPGNQLKLPKTFAAFMEEHADLRGLIDTGKGDLQWERDIPPAALANLEKLASGDFKGNLGKIIHDIYQTAHIMFSDMPQGDHKKRAKYRFASKTLMRILPAKEKAEVEGLIEKKTITLDLYEILGKCTWTPV